MRLATEFGPEIFKYIFVFNPSLRLHELIRYYERRGTSNTPLVPTMAMSIIALPDELILEILEYLSYWDLKFGMKLVCKRFYNILKSNFLAPALFRDIPRAAHAQCYTYTTLYKINPLLQYGIIPKSTAELPRPNRTVYITNLPIYAIPHQFLPSSLLRPSIFHTENAISPSVLHLKVKISNKQAQYLPALDVYGTGKGGSVTVKDAVKALITLLRSPYNTIDPPGLPLSYASLNALADWCYFQIIMKWFGGDTVWVVDADSSEGGMVVLSVCIDTRW